jgi:hypothetical protein
MPLINCLDCGKEVSNIATCCPYCGRPRTRVGRLKPIPETRLGYFFDSLVGFTITAIACSITVTYVAALLGLNAAQALPTIFAIILFIYGVDNIMFSLGFKSNSESLVNKFSYFILGPYLRFAQIFSKGQIKAKIVLIAGGSIACTIISGFFVLDGFKGQAFLSSSDFVVAQSSPAFMELKQCSSLSQCPQDYKDVAQLIRTYAIPANSNGFVQIVSYEKGVFKAILSDGNEYFNRRVSPPNRAAEAETFRPIFNKDFEQVVAMFNSNKKSSVELVVDFSRSGWANHGNGRFWRSLHRISANGNKFVVYIISNEDFLLTPRQSSNINK